MDGETTAAAERLLAELAAYRGEIAAIEAQLDDDGRAVLRRLRINPRLIGQCLDERQVDIHDDEAVMAALRALVAPVAAVASDWLVEPKSRGGWIAFRHPTRPRGEIDRAAARALFDGAGCYVYDARGGRLDVGPTDPMLEEGCSSSVEFCPVHFEVTWDQTHPTGDALTALGLLDSVCLRLGVDPEPAASPVWTASIDPAERVQIIELLTGVRHAPGAEDAEQLAALLADGGVYRLALRRARASGWTPGQNAPAALDALPVDDDCDDEGQHGEHLGAVDRLRPQLRAGARQMLGYIVDGPLPIVGSVVAPAHTLVDQAAWINARALVHVGRPLITIDEGGSLVLRADVPDDLIEARAAWLRPAEPVTPKRAPKPPKGGTKSKTKATSAPRAAASTKAGKKARTTDRRFDLFEAMKTLGADGAVSGCMVRTPWGSKVAGAKWQPAPHEGPRNPLWGEVPAGCYQLQIFELRPAHAGYEQGYRYQIQHCAADGALLASWGVIEWVDPVYGLKRARAFIDRCPGAGIAPPVNVGGLVGELVGAPFDLSDHDAAYLEVPQACDPGVLAALAPGDAVAAVAEACAAAARATAERLRSEPSTTTVNVFSSSVTPEQVEAAIGRAQRPGRSRSAVKRLAPAPLALPEPTHDPDRVGRRVCEGPLSVVFRGGAGVDVSARALRAQRALARHRPGWHLSCVASEQGEHWQVWDHSTGQLWSGLHTDPLAAVKGCLDEPRPGWGKAERQGPAIALGAQEHRRVLVELCSGTASVSLRALGGFQPLTGFMGSKRQDAERLVESLGVRNPDEVHLVDAGPWGDVFRTLKDATLRREVAAVLYRWHEQGDLTEVWSTLQYAPPDDPAERAAQYLCLQARAAGCIPIWWSEERQRWESPSGGRSGGCDLASRSKGVKRAAQRSPGGGSRQVGPLYRSAPSRGLVRIATLAERVEALDAVDWDRVHVHHIDVRAFAPIPGSRVIFDPPYKGAPRYAVLLPRQDVLAIAERHGAVAERMIVCEAEALPLDGWGSGPLRIEGKPEVITFTGHDRARSQIAAALPPEPLRLDFSAPEPTFVLLGCVKGKIAAGSVEVRDLYTGDLWARRRRYAEACGLRWGVVSAKLGVVSCWASAQPYEQHIDDVADIDAWRRQALRSLARLAGRGAVVEVIAGQAYVDALDPELARERYDITLVAPLRGLGIGERKRWLGERADALQADPPPVSRAAAVARIVAEQPSACWWLEWGEDDYWEFRHGHVMEEIATLDLPAGALLWGMNEDANDWAAAVLEPDGWWVPLRGGAAHRLAADDAPIGRWWPTADGLQCMSVLDINQACRWAARVEAQRAGVSDETIDWERVDAGWWFGQAADDPALHQQLVADIPTHRAALLKLPTRGPEPSPAIVGPDDFAQAWAKRGELAIDKGTGQARKRKGRQGRRPKLTLGDYVRVRAELRAAGDDPDNHHAATRYINAEREGTAQPSITRQTVIRTHRKFAALSASDLAELEREVVERGLGAVVSMESASSTIAGDGEAFLYWTGSKSRLVDELLAEMPAGPIDYCEPFLGGGALYLRLAADNRIRRAILSDADPDIVCLWQEIQKDPDAVFAHASSWPWTINGYEAALVAIDDLSGAARAGAVLRVNRQARQGLWRRRKEDGRLNMPPGERKGQIDLGLTIEDLRRVSRLLEPAEIRCADAEVVIDELGAGWVAYADPPYWPLSKTASFSGYDGRGFQAYDLVRTIAALRRFGLRGGHAVLSNASAAPVLRLVEAAGADVRWVSVYRSVSVKAETRGATPEILARWIGATAGRLAGAA